MRLHPFNFGNFLSNIWIQRPFLRLMVCWLFSDLVSPFRWLLQKFHSWSTYVFSLVSHPHVWVLPAGSLLHHFIEQRLIAPSVVLISPSHNAAMFTRPKGQWQLALSTYSILLNRPPLLVSSVSFIIFSLSTFTSFLAISSITSCLE